MNIKEKFWIGTFISLWLLVSSVSTIHSVEFFGLSNNNILSWCLAMAFEIGAMASLGGILISRGNKTLVWILFIVLTAFQIHGNMYWAWTHAGDITEWTKLFDLTEEDPNFTKRIFAFISGGILPLVSLGFIKSLMNYLKPKEENIIKKEETESESLVNLDTNEIESEKDDIIEDSNEDTEIDENEIDNFSENIKEDIDTKEINEEVNEDILNEVDTPLEFEDLKELNTKHTSTKLGDIIDNAEKTVNSIGEK